MSNVLHPVEWRAARRSSGEARPRVGGLRAAVTAEGSGNHKRGNHERRDHKRGTHKPGTHGRHHHGLCWIVIRRLGRFAARMFKTHILRDPFLVAHRRWVRDRGDETLRLDYPLTRDSVVFDVGGYAGDWAAKIHARYGCRIYVFEPVPTFHSRIQERFAATPAVRVFDFGLAGRDAMLPMSVDSDGSSVYAMKDGTTMVRLRSLAAVVRELGIDHVDLIKINIEGGEFELLAHLLDSGLASRFGDIQVQFHAFYPDAPRLRDELRKRLSVTHELTYDYAFVWENWRLKRAR